MSGDGEYTDEDLRRMRAGKAPLGGDGYPVELHHVQPLLEGGDNESSNLEPLTRTDHRGKRAYRRNHPASDRHRDG